VETARGEGGKKSDEKKGVWAVGQGKSMEKQVGI